MGAEGGFSNEKAAVLNILYLFFFCPYENEIEEDAHSTSETVYIRSSGKTDCEARRRRFLAGAVRRPFVEGCRSPKSRRKRSMTRESPRQRGSIADLCVYIRTPTCVTSAPPPLFLCFTPSRIRCVGEEKDRCLSLPLLKATVKKRNIIEEKSVRTTLCPTRLQIARFPFRLISVEIKLKCLGSNSPH